MDGLRDSFKREHRFMPYESVPAFVDFVRKNVNGRRTDRILDVGGGTGQLWRHISKARDRVFVTDFAFPEKTRAQGTQARVKSKLSFGDAQALPFGGKKFKHVLSTFAFDYFPDKEKALAEFKRVLSDDGKLVLVLHHPNSQPVNEAKTALPCLTAIRRFFEELKDRKIDNEAMKQADEVMLKTWPGTWAALMTADELSLQAYRRMMRELGFGYGTIPEHVTAAKLLAFQLQRGYTGNDWRETVEYRVKQLKAEEQLRRALTDDKNVFRSKRDIKNLLTQNGFNVSSIKVISGGRSKKNMKAYAVVARPA